MGGRASEHFQEKHALCSSGPATAWAHAHHHVPAGHQSESAAPENPHFTDEQQLRPGVIRGLFQAESKSEVRTGSDLTWQALLSIPHTGVRPCVVRQRGRGREGLPAPAQSRLLGAARLLPPSESQRS